MASQTTNLGLTKPSSEEAYSIDTQNTNMDLIDAAIAGKADIEDIPVIPSSLPANGGNADTAIRLDTARKINGTAFDGSKDITIEDSTKMPLTGETFTGKAYAQTNTDYSTLQLRNISASTSAVTTLANGAIHLVYEA